MLRIGINGFGRIGRAITRILAQKPGFQLLAVNELDSDLKNFAYLLKYDSVYGRFPIPVEADVESLILQIGEMQVAFYSHCSIQEVPWERHEIDVLIEATGVHADAL